MTTAAFQGVPATGAQQMSTERTRDTPEKMDS
jgi:hypothetical protein